MSLLNLVVFMIPFEELWIPGLPLNTPVSLLVLGIAALTIALRRKESVPVGVEPLFLVFSAVALFSIVHALATTPEHIFHTLPESYGFRGSRYRGLYQILIMFIMYLTAWVVLNSCSTMSELLLLLRLWFLLAIAINLFAYYEVLAGSLGFRVIYPTLQDTNWTHDMIAGRPRAYGIFSEPYRYACFLNMNIFLALGLRIWWNNGSRAARLPITTVLLTSLVALFLTSSASGFATFAVMVCAMAFMALKDLQRRGRSLALLSVVAIGLAATVFFTSVWEQLYEYKFSQAPALVEQNSEQIDSNARTRGMMMGIEAFVEHPLLGVGYGNEPFYTYMPDVGEFSFGTYSMTVSRLAEVGVIGSLVFAILIWKMFYPVAICIGGSGARSPNLSIVAALQWGLAAGMIAHLGFGCNQFGQVDWLFVGLIAVAVRARKVG